MNEKELFNVLRTYYHEKNPDFVNHTISFLLIAVSEDNDSVTMGSTHVDPKIPDTIEGLLGLKKLKKIAQNSSNGEEFRTQLKQAIKEIEKHGTGIEVCYDNGS